MYFVHVLPTRIQMWAILWTSQYYTRLRHADSKSVKESQENIQAAQDERDKYNNEKLSAYRAYRNEQNT